MDEPCVGMPGGNGALHPGAVERLREPEPAREVLSCAHIVAREDVQPAEASQEGVLSALAPDPGDLRQGLDHMLVVACPE